MAELRFLGLSQDGTQLLLADSRGRKHSVIVDSRLMAAMRLDGQPTGQREIALNTTFSPRQIQARLRAGATVADLADEYGVAVDKVERFAGPPLADRAFTADQARKTVIASHLGERPLDVVVATAAEADGVDPGSVRWDSWLREDGLWQILTAIPTGSLDQVATWTFDPHEASLRADDDTSRAMLGGAYAPEATSDAPAVDVPRRARASSAKTDGSVTPEANTSAATDHDTVAAPVAGANSAESPEEPAPARPTKRGRRASVPTWDEILFGSSSEDGDPTT